jgi:hypothetical protein
MEEKNEIKIFQVDFKCPKCKTGYLRPSNRVLTTNPPQYPHECSNPKCDYKETFNTTYPYHTQEIIKKRKPRTKKPEIDKNE